MIEGTGKALKQYTTEEDAINLICKGNRACLTIGPNDDNEEELGFSTKRNIVFKNFDELCETVKARKDIAIVYIWYPGRNSWKVFQHLDKGMKTFNCLNDLNTNAK
jgi:hypothetical protein